MSEVPLHTMHSGAVHLTIVLGTGFPIIPEMDSVFSKPAARRVILRSNTCDVLSTKRQGILCWELSNPKGPKGRTKAPRLQGCFARRHSKTGPRFPSRSCSTL